MSELLTGRGRLRFAVLATAAALALAACSGPAGQSGSGSPAASGADAKVQTIKSGVLMIGSQQSYVPGEYVDPADGKLKGFSYEIIEEIAKRLGMTTEWVQADYSALISGLEAQHYDVSSGGMSPNPDRLKLADMVGYFQSGSTFLLRKADASKYTDAQSLCGHQVGLLAGSSTLKAAFERENAACVTAGKAKIELVEYTSTPLGQQDLLSERIDAYTPDPLQAAKIVASDPKQYAWTEKYNLTPYTLNFSVLKDKNPELVKAIYSTLEELIKDGFYAKALEKYQATTGALTEPAYNGEIGAKP